VAAAEQADRDDATLGVVARTFVVELT